jgi:hypothetical protein
MRAAWVPLATGERKSWPLLTTAAQLATLVDVATTDATPVMQGRLHSDWTG